MPGLSVLATVFRHGRTVSNESLLLNLRGVTKRFAAITALEHVDFGLRRGEIHALLGENGAGKSRLSCAFRLLLAQAKQKPPRLQECILRRTGNELRG